MARLGEGCMVEHGLDRRCTYMLGWRLVVQRRKGMGMGGRLLGMDLEE
jgi:hypothetical protein